MFYSHSLLSRKGPLGTIWIAAYCFRKLNRGQIDATDISIAVDKIMPEIQMSHRVLAHLLLGIVKIFSKKVDFLYVECNETLIQMKRYRPSIQYIGQEKKSIRSKKGLRRSKEVNVVVNLLPTVIINDDHEQQQIETMRASYNQVTVTLPDRFELDSFDLGIVDIGATSLSHQLSTPQDEWKDNKSSSPFLIECSGNEVDNHSRYHPPCFTPLADILPSGIMMDVDLDLSEPQNLNNLSIVQKSLEEFHPRGDSKNNKILSEDASFGQLHKELPEIDTQIHHEHTIESDEEKIPSVEEPLNQRNTANLLGEESSGSVKENSIRKKQCVNLPFDKPKMNVSGAATSPKFMLASPAITECPRALRKRKKTYTESTILSNEVMRQTTHDSSDLVFKRRKLPDTKLDIWKIRRFSYPRGIFTDPLVPFFFPELKKLPQKKLTKILVDPTRKTSDLNVESKTKVFMQNLDAEPAVALIDPTNWDATMPDRSTENEVLKQNLDTDRLTPPNSSNHGTDIITENNTAFISNTSDNQLELMEVDFRKDDTNEKDNGWSASTRKVARYLYSSFLSLRKQKRDDSLSLLKVLKGKTRTESAKFFYEMLVLKTFGCVEVRQDIVYGDISMSATPLLEHVLGFPTA